MCHTLFHNAWNTLKKDLDGHPPVFVDSLSIAEVDMLKILGIYFDRKLMEQYD